MANMSNGFYMGQQGFATQQSGYGQAAGHQQQYGNMFTSQQQTQEMIFAIFHNFKSDCKIP